jgi:hypothetical protein
MIQSTYNHNKLSPDEEKADKKPENLTENLIINKLVNGYPTPPTPGQIVDICQKIKELPIDVKADLWQRLRDAMSQEDYDRIHTFYIRWTLGQRWM